MLKNDLPRDQQKKEVKGYDEALFKDISFEEFRASKYETSFPTFFANKLQQNSLDSENSSDDLGLPSFPLVPGVKEDFTEIEIFQDNTMDTKEIRPKHTKLVVLQEKTIENDGNNRRLTYQEALEEQEEQAAAGEKVFQEERMEALIRIEEIIERSLEEKAILTVETAQLFVQKKLNQNPLCFVYSALDISSPGNETHTGQLLVKAKQRGLRREQQILKKLAESGISPLPLKLVQYSDVSFLLLESVNAVSLAKLRVLLVRKREREAVSLSFLFSLRLLQALHKIHTLGIVHGDVSCENVLPRFGEAGLHSSSSSFSDEDPGWAQRGIVLCGWSRSLLLENSSVSPLDVCLQRLCSETQHRSCYEADLHGAAWFILQLICPNMKQETNNEFLKVIEETRNTQHIYFKELWRDVLILLLNENLSKEASLVTLEKAIKLLKRVLEEYDAREGMDKLRIALRRLEMEMYENYAF